MAAERTRRAAVLVLAALALTAVATGVLLRMRAGPAALAAFPPPPDTTATTVRVTDFVGSEACAGCHARQHAAWSASTHGRAGQAPPGDLVLRRFDGTTIRFRDAIVEPRMNGGTYEFVVRWADRVDRYPIVGVVGGAHLIGGGTQGFVWRHPDGTVRLLPFELAGDDRAWFCATGTRGRRGWVRITPEMSIADCNDWPPVRVLGSSARFVSCQECHGSQIQLDRSGRGGTRFVSLAINCESCHGPGRRHVESAHADAAATAPPTPLATLARDASVGVCMSCHAIKVEVRPGFLAGDSLAARYSLALALLGGDEVHPDGRTRAFAYQQGHYYSDCYLSGSMTCVDCHEPHGQQYRDVTGRALVGRFDDRQCTACHPSRAERPERHTAHARDSEGSRCVACHMPFVQETAVGTDIRYSRSDHTISIPRPDVDRRLGIVNACATCHRERSSAQLGQEVQRIWGAVKPLRPIVAALLAATDRADLEQILLARDTTHRLAYFDALARHYGALDGIDRNSIPRRVRSLLRQLAGSSDDDVAAIALATLHVDGGADRRIRSELVARLRALGPRDLAVRRRWAIALGHKADRYRDLGRAGEAMALYARALELLPDDPAFLLALALARLDARDFAGASHLLQRLTTIDPLNSLAWTHYGRARDAANDPQGALHAYRQATLVGPGDALAFFHLGNAHLAAGRRTDAAAAYRRAAELDAALSAAHFNLARLLIIEGRHRDAMAPLRAGLVFDPNNREARAALDHLETTGPAAR